MVGTIYLWVYDFRGDVQLKCYHDKYQLPKSERFSRYVRVILYNGGYQRPTSVLITM